MLIFFEGVDKTGKSTLVQKVLKATNYKHVVFDRGIISQIVYDKCFNRTPDESIKNAIEYLKKSNAFVLLCEADTKTIEKRLKEHNEILPDELKNIDEIKKMFFDETLKSGLDFIVLNTDCDIKLSVEKVLSALKRRVKE